jgi:AcrR family transcriptional regulator
MSTNTKERIVDAGATLFRRQGYAATGVKQIVTEAEAPFSSLYHFFPDGKDELATEIIRSSGHMFQQLVE